MTVSIIKLDVTNPTIQKYIIDTCSLHVSARRRQYENYTAENFKRMFAENRFSNGFFLVGSFDKPEAFFGLSEHDGWVVIVRYIKLNTAVLYTAVRHMFPFVLENFKHMKGVFFCSNGERTAPQAWEKRKINRATTKYWEHQEALDKFKILPYTVMYRGVEQHVLYACFQNDNDVPPLPQFKRTVDGV